jgi:hypothetical protein
MNIDSFRLNRSELECHMFSWIHEKSKHAQHKGTDNRAFSMPPLRDVKRESLPDIPWRTDSGIEVEEISYEEFLELTGQKRKSAR